MKSSILCYMLHSIIVVSFEGYSGHVPSPIIERHLCFHQLSTPLIPQNFGFPPNSFDKSTPVPSVEFLGPTTPHIFKPVPTTLPVFKPACRPWNSVIFTENHFLIFSSA